MTLLTKGMGAILKQIKKGVVDKSIKSKDLKKIHDKFFDKSGEMKQKGKDIVKEGLKGVVDRNIKSKEMFKVMKGIKGKK